MRYIFFSYCKNSGDWAHFSSCSVDESREQLTSKLNIKIECNIIKDLSLETLK